MHDAALSDRYVCQARNSISGTYAGNDFAGDPSFCECGDFFKTAPEHKRIAAFEPHHLVAFLGVFDEHAVDFFLGDLLFIWQFGSVDKLFAGNIAQSIQKRGGAQVVCDDDISLLECGLAAERDEIPRAGAATNQLDWVQILGRVSGGSGSSIGRGRIWAGIWSSHAASLEHLVMQIICSTRKIFFDRAAILLLVSRAEFWDELLGILLGDGDAGFMVSVYVSDDAMI